MKLRNKKTGEIYRFSHVTPDEEIAIMTIDGTVRYINSLTELNEEWEDYEEPKQYYFIADFGVICAKDKGKFVEDAKEMVGKLVGGEE